MALEDGRKPTRSRGGSGFKDSIREWMTARNIFAEGISQESLEFLIYRKINKKGFDGTPGLVSDVINDKLIDDLEDKIASIELDAIVSNIKRAI